MRDAILQVECVQNKVRGRKGGKVPFWKEREKGKPKHVEEGDGMVWNRWRQRKGEYEKGEKRKKYSLIFHGEHLRCITMREVYERFWENVCLYGKRMYGKRKFRLARALEAHPHISNVVKGAGPLL